MKFMLIMRATDEALAASAEVDFEEIIAAMGRYNESMIEAGVLAGGDGLAPAEEGVVVDFSSPTPIVTDGPYGETKELFNGFWIVDVKDQAEAVEWAKRAPLGAGNKLEVRRIPGIEDFPQDNEWIQKEAEWRAAAEGDPKA